MNKGKHSALADKAARRNAQLDAAEKETHDHHPKDALHTVRQRQSLFFMPPKAQLQTKLLSRSDKPLLAGAIHCNLNRIGWLRRYLMRGISGLNGNTVEHIPDYKVTGVRTLCHGKPLHGCQTGR